MNWLMVRRLLFGYFDHFFFSLLSLFLYNWGFFFSVGVAEL